MSFRTGRALPSDRETEAEEPARDELDPVLAEAGRREIDVRPLLGAVLVLAGGLLGIAVAVMLGLVVLAVVGLGLLWSRQALRRLRVERRFEPTRIVCGDDAHLVLTVWNRKLLPLPWLRAEEALPVGLLEPEPPEPAGGPDQGWRFASAGLVNGWSLGPYERVVRRIDLKADRRGVYRFGTFTLRAGDLFGDRAAEEERSQPTRLVVRPRTVPVRRFEATRDRAGDLRTRRGLFEDPSRFAGIRPYVYGDPIRHVHWRTTARLGVPVVKRFDPSRDRDVVIALDIQTTDEGWASRYDDDLVEALCVVAASLARGLEADGAACGLAVAAFTGTTDRIAFVAPSASSQQAGRIGDVLARLSSYPSATFEFLLGRLTRMVRPGTLVVLVSARDPGPYLAVARRLVRSGFGVAHLALGPNAERHARRIRAVGLHASVGQLDGTWRTAEALSVTG